eukprot:350288-Prorocentrum_minimum.AAC.6
MRTGRRLFGNKLPFSVTRINSRPALRWKNTGDIQPARGGYKAHRVEISGHNRCELRSVQGLGDKSDGQRMEAAEERLGQAIVLSGYRSCDLPCVVGLKVMRAALCCRVIGQANRKLQHERSVLI